MALFRIQTVAAGIIFASTVSLTSGRQATGPRDLTIAQAVEQALTNYPSVTVSQEQVNEAAAGIRLARSAYLPKVESIAQVNRATRNNVFGLLLPQPVIPPISGPVLGSNNFGTVWGSAAGALVTWEPFDLGLRRTSVSAATAAKGRTEAELKHTQFAVAVAAADASLTFAAALETVRAAQATVDRAEVLVRVVRGQVDAQLRPGADASRTEAELAAARTQLAQAERAAEVSRVLLSKYIGVEPGQITLNYSRLLSQMPDLKLPPFNGSTNPIAIEQNAVIDQAKAQLEVLKKSYAPRFLAQASAYARGTGASVDGNRLGSLNGLAPSTQNYALGFSMTFSAFDFASLRAREAAQEASIRSQTARYNQIQTDLKAQWSVAVADFEAARRIAANTPSQVAAAETAMRQAEARYQAGLGTIVEAADALRLLTQARIDDALARLGSWRAMLGAAVAAGDIQPFLDDASR